MKSFSVEYSLPYPNPPTRSTAIMKNPVPEAFTRRLACTSVPGEGAPPMILSQYLVYLFSTLCPMIANLPCSNVREPNL